MWRLQLVWKQHSKKRQISLSDYWSDDSGPCSAVSLSAQSSYHDKNWLQTGGVLGYHINAKISPKLQRRHRQWCLKIDEDWLFQTVSSLLLASTGNNVWASFLVHKVPCTSTTVCRYRRVSSLRNWVSDYTCHPMIANLLDVTIECIQTNNWDIELHHVPKRGHTNSTRVEVSHEEYVWVQHMLNHTLPLLSQSVARKF